MQKEIEREETGFCDKEKDNISLWRVGQLYRHMAYMYFAFG